MPIATPPPRLTSRTWPRRPAEAEQQARYRAGVAGGTGSATPDRLVEVTRRLPHTTHAALTGLRKRGYALTSEKQLQPDGRNLNVYHIGNLAAG